MLMRLIYVSTATESVDLNEFKKILTAAQTNNYRRDLTGMLAFNSKVFLQGLEGSRESVNELYAKLVRDPRHFNVTILKYEAVPLRQWSSWSMGFAAPNADNRSLFLKYSTQSIFNPYGMTGDNAESLLKELSVTAVVLDGRRPANATKTEEHPGIFGRFLR